MTSTHDRMLAAYRGQVADRVPVGIYERYLPRGGAERAARDSGLGIIGYHPVVTMPGPPWHWYPGYVSEIAGADCDIRQGWDHGVLVERRTFTTPVGAVWQEIVYDSGGEGSEHVRKHYICRREDYAVVQYLVDHTVLRRNEEVVGARIRDLDGDGILFGRLDRSPYQKCLIELAGPERFFIDLFTDPAPVQALLEALYRKQAESWVMALESQVDLLWQPDNITSHMTPPDAFRQYLLPFYQQRSREARAAGKSFLVHMDGRIRALAPLIRDSGIHVVESLSLPDIGGDMTLAEARAALPDTVVVPNVPATWCLLPDADIDARLESLMEEAGFRAAFMLQVSEDLPSDQWRRLVPRLLQATAARSA